jgi:hypothetical protein
MPNIQNNDVPENPFAADLETLAVPRRRTAAVRRSVKKVLRLSLGALRDGPTTEERWRMDNGKTWQQAHGGDDV